MITQFYGPAFGPQDRPLQDAARERYFKRKALARAAQWGVAYNVGEDTCTSPYQDYEEVQSRPTGTYTQGHETIVVFASFDEAKEFSDNRRAEINERGGDRL